MVGASRTIDSGQRDISGGEIFSKAPRLGQRRGAVLFRLRCCAMRSEGLRSLGDCGDAPSAGDALKHLG
jgi:hypothetical protein